MLVSCQVALSLPTPHVMLQALCSHVTLQGKEACHFFIFIVKATYPFGHSFHSAYARSVDFPTFLVLALVKVTNPVSNANRHR